MDVSDYLTVELDETLWSKYSDVPFPACYRVFDTKTKTFGGAAFRHKHNAEAKLNAWREEARARWPYRPKRPASYVRWLYGFPLLPEHNETQEEYLANRDTGDETKEP